MKHPASFILLCLFISVCNGQPKPGDNSKYSAVIKEQANKMMQFLMKKDFQSFSQFTYPEVVEMMGGKDKMIAALEAGTKQMEAQETYFKNAYFGEPSKIITSGNELQCVVPQTIEMKVPNGKLVTKTSLIAISTDKGKKWYFVDSGGKDLATLKNALPDLSNELIIPGKQEPQFIKD